MNNTDPAYFGGEVLNVQMEGRFSGTLLVSDIDGTLVAADQRIPQANCDAVAQYCAQGGRFALASGRTHSTAGRITRQLMPNAPCIFINGAEIYDLQSERTLYQRFLAPELDDVLRAYGARFPEAGVLVFTTDRQYVIQGNRWTDEHDVLTGVPSVPITWDELPLQKYKLVFMAPADTVQRMMRYCAEQKDPRVEYNRSWPEYFELMPRGGNKGEALIQLCAQLGIPRERCFAIGDYDNDAEMLRAAGISAAPQNASAAARAAAGMTVCDCESGAVADFLRRIEQNGI